MKYVFIFLLFYTELAAQELTGVWKGYFYTYGNKQFQDIQLYEFEVHLIQLDSNTLQMITTTFQKEKFYCQANAKGTYNFNTKQIIINEYELNDIKYIDKKNACLMKCVLTLSTEKNEKILKGDFTSKNNYTNSECGKGSVHLEKKPFPLSEKLLKFAKKYNKLKNQELAKIDSCNNLKNKMTQEIKGTNKYLKVVPNY